MKIPDMKLIRQKNLIKWFDQYPIHQSEKSLISQLKNGKGSFGEKLARRLERDYHMPSMYLDEENNFKNNINNNMEKGYIVRSIQSNKELSDMAKDFNENVIAIEFDNDYAIKVFSGLPQEDINFASFIPDTMEDTIKRGSTIFLDTSIKRFIGSGIYMFVYDNFPHLNRLQMRASNLLVISDNNHYKEWEIKKEDFDKIVIMGKVISYYPPLVII